MNVETREKTFIMMVEISLINLMSLFMDVIILGTLLRPILHNEML